MPTIQPAAAAHSATEAQPASRYNAVKHGIVAVRQIMFDESVEDLAELAAEYHEHHSPADREQRLLVDTLIHNEWRLRRMRRVEAVLWEHAANAFLAQHPEAEACNSAHAFSTNSGHFERQVARAPWPARPGTRSRAPATPTIHNHFRKFGFDPSKSENPASGSPQTTRRHANCQPACRPTRLGEPRENLVKTARSLPRTRWKELTPPSSRCSSDYRPICGRHNLQAPLVAELRQAGRGNPKSV